MEIAFRAMWHSSLIGSRKCVHGQMIVEEGQGGQGHRGSSAAITSTRSFRYYAGLSAPSPTPSYENNADAIARGQAIAQRGIPDQRVPSCVDCHGPGGQPKNAAYPALAGQHADYLVLQLELFKKGDRGGSPYEHLMRPVAARLKPEPMRDVALYFESLQRPQPQAAGPNSAP